MRLEEIKQEAHKMMLFAISNQADIEPVMNQLDIAIDKATAKERKRCVDKVRKLRESNYGDDLFKKAAINEIEDDYEQ